jgi:hypothetical protein
MAWLTDLAEYLEDQSVGTVGTSIFIAHMPDSPNAAIAVYDAGGSSRPHGYDVPWEEHSFEIRVRSTGYAAAETLMGTVLSKLDHKQAFAMNTTLNVQWVAPVAPPALLYYDEKDRAVWLGRFVMQTERAAVFSA